MPKGQGSMTVMPLSELHSNHPARNGVGQPQDDLHDGRFRTGTPNGDENSDILKNPSSIQSMLRNTTETGNVGQFSIKPSRVPPSLPRPSKPRMTPNKQRQPGAYYNRVEDSSTEHTSLHSRHEAAASSGSAFQNQSRPYRGSPRSPSVEDHRSYSTTKSSHVGHSLTSHHSQTNGGHGGSGGPHHLRPRSPFAYPTRLKRPGYRPSSPALSELHKQNRSQTSLHRRPSFRTNSPSSLHTNGARSPWRKGVNRSDPLLRYYPQSAVPTPGRAPSPSPAFIRPPPLKASPSLKSTANSAISLQATTNGSWINPQSPNSSPMFYDYSEAFEEPGVEQQDYAHHVSMSTGTLVEHQMHDTATTTYYELDASFDTTSRAELISENSFPKLSTQATDNRFDQSTSEFEIDDGSSMQALHKDLSEVPELPEGDLSNTLGSVAPGKHDDGAIDRDSRHSHPKEASPLVVIGEDSKQIPEHEKRQESFLQPQNTAYTLRVSGNPNRGTSSPIDSIHSAQSTPTRVSEVKGSPPKIPKAIPNITASPPPAGNPAADSDHGKYPEGESRHSLQLVRAISFEDHPGNEHTATEIISPTPDRSMTSPTSLGRFSKILSINDGLLDLDDLAKRIKGKDRADSPMQGIVDSRARVARIEPPWRKRSVQLRDIATRQNAADYALVEASDSEDEPELTQGLRQTFCKPDERPSEKRPRSPPIILPSQLVHRGYPGPLSIRRSPAVRRSKSDFRKVLDLPDTHPDQDLDSPEEIRNPTVPFLEAKQLSAVYLDADQDSESSRKYSIHRCSTPDIEPPRIANEESHLLPAEAPAIVSLPTPVAPLLPSLPFSFTPLTWRKSKDETIPVPEIEDVASSPSDQGKKTHEDEEIAVQKPATRLGLDTSSVSSSPGSRPWNLDTSYPWSDQQPKFEVTMPERRGETEDPNQSTRNLPRFRFKIQRASSNTEGTENVTKYPLFSDVSSSPFAPSHDVVQGTAFRRTRYPTLSVMPGQINSSHDALRSNASRTRFGNSFETQSPRITLVPQSPGFEARSFFSDDSSQVRPRGAFRKRFSALRNRTSRGASADEPRGYDRGLLGSALGRSRASGRSSRQSENTAITAGVSSHTKRARRKLVNKLRSWWQRGEDRVREWRWRRRYNGAVGRSMSADPYAGV